MPPGVLDTADRVAEAAASVGAEWFMLTGADSVCYATGVPMRIETGPSPFEGGPTTVFVDGDGTTAVVAATPLADEWSSTGARVFEYSGFSAGDPEDLVANYGVALTALIRECGVSGTVAYEPASLTAAVADALRGHGMQLADGHAALARLRAVKTDRELTLLRESARVASLGQRQVLRSAVEDVSELELFAAVRLAMETAAGERIPVAGDLLTGSERTAGVAGWATNRRIQPGDAVMSDIAPRVRGYWADSCNTSVVGEPSVRLRELRRVVLDAMDAGIAAAVPGTSLGDLDRTVREVVERAGFGYAHHSGHGIGTSVHEYPRIIPGERGELEPGMVILLEPGAYLTGVGGIRLEWMFEVTAAGVDKLTDFELATW